MRTRHRVRWWSRREKLLGGGNISLCLMACPAARAVWCPSLEFFLPDFFLRLLWREGACIDGDGMGWDGGFCIHQSLLFSICPMAPHSRAGRTGRVWQARRTILQPLCITQANSRASVDRNDDFLYFCLLSITKQSDYLDRACLLDFQ